MIGFCVIYRWKVRPGMEDQFQSAWHELTHEFKDQHGGLGSRLHKSSDGTWLAYAQWPSREAWSEAEIASAQGLLAMRQMQDAVAERLEPILLEPIADLLEASSND